MARFLFYIEPFPIRNTLLHFEGVIRLNFGRSILANATEHECFIYANRPTLEKIAQTDPGYERHFVVPTAEEDAFFTRFLTLWDDAGIVQWKELMRPSSVSEAFKKVILDIHRRCPFDYICCWGTNAAVAMAAKELGVGFVAMELGCSREPYLNTLAIDPWGVNGGSTMAKAQIADLEAVPPSDAEDDLLFVNGLNSAAYESQFTYFNDSTILNKIGGTKFAYVALQLYDDANLLEYSPFDTVEDVLMSILPDLQKAGYTCIVKEHPKSMLRRGSNYANIKAKVYALGFDNVIWLTAKDTGVSNSVLYRLSDVVVTTNSSVGFEALFFEKPVVVLGEAVYKVGGVFPTLREYLSGAFDAERYRRQIGQIRNFFLRDYLFPAADAQDARVFLPYLKFIGDLSRSNLTIRQIVDAYRNRSGRNRPASGADVR